MRSFRGHSSCRGGVCGASGCWSGTEIKACCMAVTSCTAYYGSGGDWWTFHGECVLKTHGHSYSTCMKPNAETMKRPDLKRLSHRGVRDWAESMATAH